MLSTVGLDSAKLLNPDTHKSISVTLSSEPVNLRPQISKPQRTLRKARVRHDGLRCRRTGVGRDCPHGARKL